MSTNNEVKLRPVKCPTCGGSIEFPVGRNKAACPFCGNEVVVDEAGWLGQLDEFEMRLKNAECALENKEWERARTLYEECLNINSTDPRCWKGLIEARTRGLTAGFDQTTEPNYRSYIGRAGNDADADFVARYRDFLHNVADNDTSRAADHAKDNIEYYGRYIESEKERIVDQEKKISEIRNRPEAEAAEKRYGTVKAKFTFSTVMLFLAPLITVGMAVLAVVLIVRCFTGDVHIGGIIASLAASVIFAGVTRYVWKHYRNSVHKFKSTRLDKVREDDVNLERARSGAEQISNREDDIARCRKTIEDLEQAIAEQNEYLAIDRGLRLAYFEKIHLDGAGIANDITVDPAVEHFVELERTTKPMPGTKSLTNLKKV